MGLDQTLNWIGEPSRSQIERIRHKNLSEITYATGMMYISEDDYKEDRYKHIRGYMIPEKVYTNEIDWRLITSDCGMPEDAHICGIGQYYVKFGRAVNTDDVKEFYVDVFDKRYCKPVLSKLYFYLLDEVYQWRNNYKIQELFDSTFPDEWCDYKQRYQMMYGGYYPINDVFDKMQLIDSGFASQYKEGVNNIFYESNW